VVRSPQRQDAAVEQRPTSGGLPPSPFDAADPVSQLDPVSPPELPDSDVLPVVDGAAGMGDD
jgi:hypothetical protein